MKQKLIPIISVVIGLLAFGLTFRAQNKRDDILQSKIKDLYKGAEQEVVMVASRDLPAGVIIRAHDLKYGDVFKSSGTSRMVKKEDGKLVIGRKTLESIAKNEPVRWSDIKGGDSRRSGLAPLISPKLRAISISVGGASAVSSMVRPNDRVDLLGTFSIPDEDNPDEMKTETRTILQDVTVLATGQDMARNIESRSSNKRAGYSTVTLEVDPREAELLVFVQQLRGNLTLTLRNPDDLGYEKNLPSVDFKHLNENLESYNINRQRFIRHKKNVR